MSRKHNKFKCCVFLIILLNLRNVMANWNLYLTGAEMKRLMGVDTKTYYVKSGIANEYALRFMTPISEKVHHIDFTWEARSNKQVLYNIAVWKNETIVSDAMRYPSVNISYTGTVPQRTQTFRLHLPCTGLVSSEVEVTLNINATAPVSIKPPTVIKYKCKKLCIENVASEFSISPTITNKMEDLTEETDVSFGSILVPVVGGIGLVMLMLAIAGLIMRHFARKNKRDQAFYNRGDIQSVKSGGISAGSALMQVQNEQKPAYILPSSYSINSYTSLRKYSVVTQGSNIHNQMSHPIPMIHSGSNTVVSSRNGTINGSVKLKPENVNDTCVSSSSLSRSEILSDPTTVEIQEKFRNINIERQRIRLTSVLYEGGFGRVFRGCIQRERPEQDQQVIIKTVVEAAPEEEALTLCRDGSQLHNIYHVNILTMMGTSFSEGSPAYLIYPFHNYNNLKFYLLEHRGGNLRAAELVELAVQAAQGLAFLHSSNVLHGDIAARNCVVSDKLQLRITDSALARDLFRQDYDYIGTSNLRPVKWMALESIDNGVISTACDVWSYGVLLWELTTLAQQPYVEVATCEMSEYLRNGYRLAQPLNCPDDLYQVMAYCWAIKPTDRPTAMTLLEYLAAFSKQLHSFI